MIGKITRMISAIMLLAERIKSKSSIIKGDQLSVPLHTKASSHINYTYWVDPKHKSIFKIHPIIDEFKKEVISVQNPLCTKSEIFRSTINMVWFICDNEQRFRVWKYDRSFRVAQIGRDFAAKTGARFLDGSSTEDRDHFITLQAVNHDMYVSLYSFEQNKMIHEVKLSMNNAGQAYKNPRLALYCRSELMGNECYGIIHDWRGTSKHLILLKYHLNGNVKHEITVQREFLFSNMPGVMGDEIEAMKEVERKLMISFRNTAGKKMYHTIYDPYEGKPYFKHIKTIAENFKDGDQVFMVEDFMGEFRMIKTYDNSTRFYSFGYLKENRTFEYFNLKLATAPCGFNNSEYYVQYADPGNIRTLVAIGKKNTKELAGFFFFAYGEGSPNSMIRCYVGNHFKYAMFHAAFDEYISWTSEFVSYYSHEVSWVDFTSEGLTPGKNEITLIKGNNDTVGKKPFHKTETKFEIDYEENPLLVYKYDEATVDYIRSNSAFQCFLGSTCHASILSYNEFKSNAGKFSLVGGDIEIDNENFKQVKLEFPNGDLTGKIKTINLLGKSEMAYLIEGRSEAEYVRCHWDRMAVQKCDQEIVKFDISNFEDVEFVDLDHYIIAYGKKKQGPNSTIEVFRKSDGKNVNKMNLNHTMTMPDYLDRSTSSLLFYIVGSGKEAEIFKIQFKETKTGVEIIKPVAQPLRDSYHEICPSMVRIHPYDYDEIWVLSKCPNKDPIVLAFEFTEVPLYVENDKVLEFGNNQKIDNFCPIFVSIVYIDIEGKKIWMRPTNTKKVSDESRLQVPIDFLNISKIINFDCAPGRNSMQVLIQSQNGKFYMLNLLGLKDYANSINSRIHSVEEIKGIDNPKFVSIETREGGRDIYTLITSENLSQKSLYKINMENNEIYFKSKNDKFMSSTVQLRFQNFYRNFSKDIPFKFVVDKMGSFKPEIEFYKPFVVEENQVDVTSHFKWKGPYFGIEIEGKDASKVEVDDRLMPEKSPLEGAEADDYVGSFQNFVISGTSGGKIELHKDLFGKTKETVKLGEGATEAIIFGSDDKTMTFVASRLRTADGNQIEVFWFKSNIESINKTQEISSFKIRSKGDEFGLYGVFNRSKSKNFLVIGLMHQSRRYVKFFYMDFTKDYKDIITVNQESIYPNGYVKNVVIDEKDRIKIVQSGMKTILAYTKEPGHKPVRNKIGNIVNGEHMSSVFCDYENACLMETPVSLFYIKGKTVKMITKVPNFKILGGSFYSKYLALIGEKMQFDDNSPRVFKLFIYSIEETYLHSAYDLEIPKNLKIDDFNRMITVTKKNENEFAVITCGKIKLKVTSKAHMSLLAGLEGTTPLQLKLQDKIKAKVNGEIEDPDNLKLVLKGESKQFEVKRGFYKDEGVDPNKPILGKVNYWMVAVVSFLIIFGIMMICFCIARRAPSDKIYSVTDNDLNMKLNEEDANSLL